MFFLIYQISVKRKEKFQNVMNERFSQAKRSILIQSPLTSFNELEKYCSKFGALKNIFRYEVQSRSYFLFEFDRSKSAEKLIQSSIHVENVAEGRVLTKCRYLNYSPESVKKLMKSNKSTTNGLKLKFNQEINTKQRDQILRSMRTQKTIDQQMKMLFQRNSVSDLSCRLRFLTALQIEEAVSGFFFNAQVVPFGSTVNGFGRMQSDLDMIVVFKDDHTKLSDSIFIEPKFRDNSRDALRTNLQTLSSIMKCWITGISEIQNILNARIPIIKYIHNITNLECDLSMSNT